MVRAHHTVVPLYFTDPALTQWRTTVGTDITETVHLQSSGRPCQLSDHDT